MRQVSRQSGTITGQSPVHYPMLLILEQITKPDHWICRAILLKLGISLINEKICQLAVNTVLYLTESYSFNHILQFCQDISVLIMSLCLGSFTYFILVHLNKLLF